MREHTDVPGFAEHDERTVRVALTAGCFLVSCGLVPKHVFGRKPQSTPKKRALKGHKRACTRSWRRWERVRPVICCNMNMIRT